MRHVDIGEGIDGRFDHVLVLLRLEFEFDHVFREPLDELRVPVGAGFFGRRLRAEVGPVLVGGRSRDVEPGTLAVPVSWRAAEHAALFPTMTGQLVVRDEGAANIDVRLIGEYRPPLGAVGAMVDRLFAQRAAAASLREYLHTVATRLAARLAEHSLPRQPRPSQGSQRSP